MKIISFIRQQRLLCTVLDVGLPLSAAGTTTWIYLNRMRTVVAAEKKSNLQNIARMARDLIDAQDLPSANHWWNA